MPSADGLPPDSTVAFARLPVTVVPPPVRLALAFEPPTLELRAGAAATVVLNLPDVPAGAEVPVTLSSADAALALGLFSSDAGGSKSAVFTAAATNRVVTIFSGTEGSAALTASADVSGASGLPPDSTVAPAQLEVTVVPAPVRLALAFDPMSLTVAAGTTATATLSLPGVPEGTTVTVTLSSADGATLQVASTPTLVFGADTSSHRVTVASLDDLNGARVTVTADFSEDSGLPDDSTVAPAELEVTVVPPPPVHLRLAFDSPALTVAVNGDARTVLRLLGDVPAGARVNVFLRTTDEDVADVSGRQFLELVEAQGWSESAEVFGVAEGVATLIAEVPVLRGFLPEDSTVAPAELEVTVVESPTAVLQLAFRPSALTVVAGSTATAVLSLSGGVPEGVAVTVMLSVPNASTAQLLTASGQGVTEMVVTVTELRFTAAAESPVTTATVTVVGVAEGSVTLTAEAVRLDVSGLSRDSSVAPAQLPVTVVLPPVHLALAFDPPTLTLVEGSQGEVNLSLPDVPAGVELEVRVVEANAMVAEVVLPDLHDFSQPNPITIIRIRGLAAGNTTLTAALFNVRDLPLPPDSTVEPAELAVTVVPPPVHLQLAFDPTSLTVAVGSVEFVLLRLVGDVPASARVEVSFIGTDVADVGSFSIRLFGAAASRLSISGNAEGITTLVAKCFSFCDDLPSLPPDSTVAPAELLVTVVPAPVHLQLAFDPSSLTVTAGNSQTVQLRLLGEVPEGAEVSVSIGSPDFGSIVDVEQGLRTFDAATTSRGVRVTGLAEGNTIIETAFHNIDDFTDFGLPPDSTVARAGLRVTVVPAPLRLVLAFDRTTLTVATGATATATLSLLGELPADAEVTVALALANETTARLVMEESLVFDAATTNQEVIVEGVTVGNMTVTADAVLPLVNLPPDSSVAPADLAVAVVPPPVHLRLAFDPPLLTVVAGDVEEVLFRLLGDVPVDATFDLGDVVFAFMVSLADEMTARLVPETFTVPGDQLGTVMIEGVAAGSATVTMTLIGTGHDGLPPGSTVMPAAPLPVTVLPAPPVRLRLAFDPTSLTVAVDGVATATLSLLGVPAGIDVNVDVSVVDEFSVPDDTTARVVTPRVVEFTASTPSYEVTVAGVVVGNAPLLAMRVGGDIVDEGFPPGSNVFAARLPITVVPLAPPVELALSFDRPALTVAVNDVGTVALDLPGVPAGFVVRVDLSVAGGAAGLVSSSGLTGDTFGVISVGIRGQAVGSAVLTAVADLSPVDNCGLSSSIRCGLPEGSTVMSAQLPITVVPAPVHLALAFDPMSLTLVVGATATVTLSLPGMPDRAALRVDLSSADSETAQVGSMAENFFESEVFPFPSVRGVKVTGVAVGSATLTARADLSLVRCLPSFPFVDCGLPPDSTVAPAELLITVVPAPVHLALSFDQPALTVAVNDVGTVALDLPGVPAGATVAVLLGVPDGEMTVRVPGGLGFTADEPSREVTVEGVAVGSVTLLAHSPVGSAFGLPEGSTVMSAQLPITVVPAPVHLQLAFDPTSLTLVVGATATAMLSLPDVPAGFLALAELTGVEPTGPGETVELVTSFLLGFDRTSMPHMVTIKGVAVGNVTLTAVMGDCSRITTECGLPPDSTVEPAELLITVVPAPIHLALAFDPTSLTVVEGSEATVDLSLPDVPAGATVSVLLGVPDGDS